MLKKKRTLRLKTEWVFGVSVCWNGERTVRLWVRARGRIYVHTSAQRQLYDSLFAHQASSPLQRCTEGLNQSDPLGAQVEQRTDAAFKRIFYESHSSFLLFLWKNTGNVGTCMNCPSLEVSPVAKTVKLDLHWAHRRLHFPLKLQAQGQRRQGWNGEMVQNRLKASPTARMCTNLLCWFLLIHYWNWEKKHKFRHKGIV